MATQQHATGEESQATIDVLVVESDNLVESVLVSGFENEGIDAGSIDHGYQCQRAIEAVGRPRVIVVDAVLPCTDGIELGADLDERYDGTTVFVVNTTRQSSQVDLSETDVRVRPTVDPVSLVDTVSECL